MYAGYPIMKIASEAGMNCFDSKKADKTAQKTIVFDIISTAWLCFCFDIFNCVIEMRMLFCFFENEYFRNYKLVGSSNERRTIRY